MNEQEKSEEVSTPRAVARPSEAMTLVNKKSLPIPPLETIKELLAEYLSGADLETAAKARGISRRALYAAILGGVYEEQLGDLVTAFLAGRIADADRDLEHSLSHFAYVIAKERAFLARKDLERRRPGIYGPPRSDGRAVAIQVVLGLEGRQKTLDVVHEELPRGEEAG